MIRWLIVEVVIANVRFLRLYTAARLLLHFSHPYIKNKGRERQNSNALSPFHATPSL